MSLSPAQDWCKENFVNAKNMMLAGEVRAQLRDICLKVPFLPRPRGANLALVSR